MNLPSHVVSHARLELVMGLCLMGHVMSTDYLQTLERGRKSNASLQIRLPGKAVGFAHC